MSNGSKAVRVAYVFGILLPNKFLGEHLRFLFLLTVVRFIQIYIFAF
jgi:hypothetical protein